MAIILGSLHSCMAHGLVIECIISLVETLLKATMVVSEQVSKIRIGRNSVIPHIEYLHQFHEVLQIDLVLQLVGACQLLGGVRSHVPRAFLLPLLHLARSCSGAAVFLLGSGRSLHLRR